MNLNTRTTSLAFILGLATLSGSAFGQNFYSTSWLGHADSLSGGTYTDLFDSHSGTAPVTSQVSGNATYSDPVGGDIQLSGTGKGRSGYINLGTYADASITNAHAIASGNPGQYYQVAGIAGYQTAFTIFGPSLVQNDIYTQRFTFSFDGTSQSSTGVESQGFVYLGVGSDPGEGEYLQSSTTFQSGYHTFTAGTSNSFQLELDSWVNFFVDNLTPGNNYSATTDFYHSLKLTGVDILDANGNAVNDFKVVDSNNGQTVFASGALAPEPASMAALGFGVIALIRRRKSAK